MSPAFKAPVPWRIREVRIPTPLCPEISARAEVHEPPLQCWPALPGAAGIPSRPKPTFVPPSTASQASVSAEIVRFLRPPLRSHRLRLYRFEGRLRLRLEICSSRHSRSKRAPVPWRIRELQIRTPPCSEIRPRARGSRAPPCGVGRLCLERRMATLGPIASEVSFVSGWRFAPLGIVGLSERRLYGASENCRIRHLHSRRSDLELEVHEPPPLRCWLALLGAAGIPSRFEGRLRLRLEKSSYRSQPRPAFLPPLTAAQASVSVEIVDGSTYQVIQSAEPVADLDEGKPGLQHAAGALVSHLVERRFHGALEKFRFERPVPGDQGSSRCS